MKYVGYKKFILQIIKFNKHPILTANVIECSFLFSKYYILKMIIEVTSSSTTCLKELFFLP
jgi:hypothetical protein